jgi:glycosyltransferase involved in cell wall biosynthesis
MFTICSMPVGGAEKLLVELIRGLDRSRIEPELCCLKDLGPLGESLSREIPVHSWLWKNKYDFTILFRMMKLFAQRRMDGVVTVGAGDKMFWGRLAAWRLQLPCIVSAVHSTGWPDTIERANRWLTPMTDAFVGVADRHGRYLVEQESFPPEKVRVIPNGVDTDRFRPSTVHRADVRNHYGWHADDPVCGVVAALRPEKNVELFLRTAAQVRQDLPRLKCLIVGDGPEREKLEQLVGELELQGAVQFTGMRSDIPRLVAAMDLFSLTSHNEANPVSILEAMSCGVPIVATDVGSISEVVSQGVSGFVAPAGDGQALAAHWRNILAERRVSRQLGRVGRDLVVKQWSLQRMVRGYEDLLTEIYNSKVDSGKRDRLRPEPAAAPAQEPELVGAG